MASVVSETTLTVDAGVLTAGAAFTILQDRYYIGLMDKNGGNRKNLSTGIAVPGQIYSDLDPSWSPKGDKIAFASWRESSVLFQTNDIFVADINPAVATPLTGLTNLTTDPAWYDSSLEPEWSPDATKLVYHSQRAPGPGTDLWIQDPTTTAGPTAPRLTNTATIKGSPTWSPDGTSIAFHEDGDLYSVPAAGGSPLQLTNTVLPTSERQPDWNRLLVATNDTYAVPTGGSGNQAAPGVMSNDVGLGGNPLATASMVTGPAHTAAGSLALSADGSFTYTHDGSAMDDSFTYKVTDAGGNVSNTATVTLDTPFNAAPVANPEHLHRRSVRHTHGAGAGRARQ